MKKIREEVMHIRREFNFGSLDEKDISDNPMDILQEWLEDAIRAEIKDPNAFVLSTVQNNQVDNRVVLLRDAYEGGLEFFTNYNSKKGQDITHNNQIAINFFWADLDRQIRIHAKVNKLASKLSDDYFQSRPRSSQLGAWASNQSHRLKDRQLMEDRIVNLEKRFEGKEVSRPDFWGGYLAVPFYYEFWQGRPSRLHDRICFESEGESWTKKRLFP